MKLFIKKNLKRILMFAGAFVLGFVLYFLTVGKNKNDVPTAVKNPNSGTARSDVKYYTEGGNKQPKLSMKQIDSMSANLNFKFTIQNRISDSISAASNVDPKEAKWVEKNK